MHTNELLYSCFFRLVFTNVSVRCGGKLPVYNKFRLVEHHQDFWSLLLFCSPNLFDQFFEKNMMQSDFPPSWLVWVVVFEGKENIKLTTIIYIQLKKFLIDDYPFGILGNIIVYSYRVYDANYFNLTVRMTLCCWDNNVKRHTFIEIFYRARCYFIGEKYKSSSNQLNVSVAQQRDWIVKV